MSFAGASSASSSVTILAISPDARSRLAAFGGRTKSTTATLVLPERRRSLGGSTGAGSTQNTIASTATTTGANQTTRRTSRLSGSSFASARAPVQGRADDGDGDARDGDQSRVE